MTITEKYPGMRGELVAPPPTNKRNRAEWLRARKAGLGASEVATILGLAPTGWKTSPLGIWLDKTSPDIDDGDVTERMEWGTELEAPVARVFAKRHARELGIRVAGTPGLLRHEEHSWMLATPDRVGIGLRSKVAEAVVEVKTSDAMMRKEWDDGAPFHYAIQVQCQLAVTGLPVAYLVPLFGGNYMPEPFPVERDELAIQQIVEICGAWWERYVVGREMPPAIVADMPALTSIYPGDEGVLTVDDEVAAELSERARLRVEIENRTTRMEEIDLHVKTLLQDAKYAVDEDGNTLATWSRFGKRSTDWKSLTRDHPEVADLVPDYTTKKPSGRFIVSAPFIPVEDPYAP